MENKYYKNQKVFGINYLYTTPFEPRIVEGFFFKEFYDNGNRIIVLKRNEKDSIRNNLQNKFILTQSEKYNLFLTTQELSEKYNKKKYKELQKLIKKSNNSKKLPYIAFTSFFEGVDVLSRINPNKQTWFYYFFKKIFNVLKFIFDLLSCDFVTSLNLQKRIYQLKNEIECIERNIFLTDFTNDIKQYQKDIKELTNQKIKKQKAIDELINKKNVSFRSISTMLLTILSLFILYKQASISKNQTSIQSEQLQMQDALNQPKFNIYLDFDNSLMNESLHIKKINDAYISNVIYETLVLCIIDNKLNSKTFKVKGYFDKVTYNPRNITDEYIFNEQDNLLFFQKLQTYMNENNHTCDLRRYVKISYIDYLGKKHEEYFEIIPLYGLVTGTYSDFFNTDYLELTLPEAIDFYTPKLTEE